MQIREAIVTNSTPMKHKTKIQEPTMSSVVTSFSSEQPKATRHLLLLPPEVRDKIWCMVIPNAQLREVSRKLAAEVRTANAVWTEAKDIATALQDLRAAVKSKSSAMPKEDQELQQQLRHKNSELEARMKYSGALNHEYPGRFCKDFGLPVMRDFEPVAITDPGTFGTCRQMREEARRCMFEQNVIAIKFETKGRRAQRRNMQLARSVLESSLDGLSHARNILVTVRAIDVWSLKTALEGRSNIHKLHVLLKTSISNSYSSYIDQAVSRLQPLGAIPVRDEAIVAFARAWFDNLSDDSELKQALKAIEDEMLRSWAKLSRA